MSVQAIAWSSSGAVRIIDQRALPDAEIERDLESAEAVADAIRTLQVRGAPLIGIAAAMGLVAGLRADRGAPRDAFLARLARLVELLAASRPTAVNLRWALDRMARAAAAAPGDGGGAALWERLQAEATAIWEEDRAMCRRIGEAGLPLVPDGAKVLTHCNAGALATGVSAPRSRRCIWPTKPAARCTSSWTRRGRCCRALGSPPGSSPTRAFPAP